MRQRVKTWLSGALACGLALTGAGLAHGQRVEVRTEGSVRGGTAEVRRVSTVLHAEVMLQDGDRVGRVEDFVINDNGCIDYLVLAREDRFVLVPWAAARVDFGRHAVRIDITKERFERVPTFTKDRWAEATSAAFTGRVRTFFNVSERGRREGDRYGAERREGDRDRREGAERRDADRDRREGDRERRDADRDRRESDRDRRDTDRDRREGDRDRRDTTPERRPTDRNERNATPEPGNRDRRDAQPGDRQDRPSRDAKPGERPERPNETPDRSKDRDRDPNRRSDTDKR